MSNICIVAHFAYGAIAGGRQGHVGGVERQTSLLSRWLVAHGHQVSLLTWDEGQEDECRIDGVRVIKMCRQEAGIPGLRFFHPRWTSLVRAMKQANAGIYYHNCAEYVTGQVALWCRQNRRRFVFSAASDQDCDARLPGLPKWRERVLYRYGLRAADRVIVQTNKQRNMLMDGFGIDSTVLPMPCPGPTDLEYRPPADPTPSGTRVLWAGRIARVKRLEMLIDVARALPQVIFDVAGMPYRGDTYSENVMTEASRLPNIVLHGTVPRERMGGLYQNASLFCNTSEYEGFPNTFLEAWSHGLPIVSTVDPDGLIASRKLGLAAHDVAGIVDGIRAFIEHPGRWREMSVNSRSHYIANHTAEQVMRQFESVFTGTLENGRP